MSYVTFKKLIKNNNIENENFGCIYTKVGYNYVIHNFINIVQFARIID